MKKKFDWSPLNSLSAYRLIYSNKKDTSVFHGTVYFDPIKMSQQKIYQNVYQTSDTQNFVTLSFYFLIWKSY